jgi:arylsulfatase A-like enzyme
MVNKADLRGMNVLIFITDQQRATQHFPPHWAEQNLPGLTRLKRHGLTFERAFCDSCMCSPSRATLMTGYFPAQHGVKWTPEESMPDDQYPQSVLPPDFLNLGTVMAAAGSSHMPWFCTWISCPPWQASSMRLPPNARIGRALIILP